MKHDPNTPPLSMEDRQYFMRRECIQCAHLIPHDKLVQTREGDLCESCVADYEAEHGKVERVE